MAVVRNPKIVNFWEAMNILKDSPPKSSNIIAKLFLTDSNLCTVTTPSSFKLAVI